MKRARYLAALVAVLLSAAVLLELSASAPFAPQDPAEIESCTEDDSVNTVAAITSLPTYQNDTYTVELHYSISPDVDSLRVSVPTQPTYVSNGTYEDGLVRVNESATSATVRFTQHPGEDKEQRLPQYNTSAWLLVAPPSVDAAWMHDGEQHCTEAFTAITGDVVKRNGITTVGTDEMVYATTENATVDAYELAEGRTLTLVTPTRAEDDMPPQKRQEIGQSIQQVSSSFDVGCHRDVMMFALPEPQQRATGYAVNRGDETGTWVTSSVGAKEDDSTWLHEYIHARQCANTAADMEWFTEASANYYATTFAYSLYDSPQAWSYSPLTFNVSEGAVLKEPSTWRSTGASYQKGARVLIWLDAQIQSQSDENLQTVLRWMNNHDGQVTYAEFRNRVVTLTDEETGEQLDTYVTQKEQVPLDDEAVETLRTQYNETSVPPPTR